jgi:hypothetical protein
MNEEIKTLIQAGEALLARLDEMLAPVTGKPTIAELEAILASAPGAVEIMPDGSVYSAPRAEIEAFRAALAQAQSGGRR